MKSQNKVKAILLILTAALVIPMAIPAFGDVTSVTITPSSVAPAYIRTIGTPAERTVAFNCDVLVDRTNQVVDRQISILTGTAYETTINPVAKPTPVPLSFSESFGVQAPPNAANSNTTPEGWYTARVRYRQPASGAWDSEVLNTNAVMVDNTAPTVPGVPSASPSPNTGACTVSWDASSDPTSGGVSSGVADYELQRRYSSDGGTTWSDWSKIASPATNSYDDSGLAEGLYQYRVRARDRANNFSGYSDASASVMVDKTAPTSTITAPSDGDTICVGTLVSITGTANDATSNGVASGVASVAVTVGSTSLIVTGTTSWSAEWTPDTPGTYTITSVATDNAGNVQSTVTSITVEVVECGECVWEDETAWADGADYVDQQGNWATYTAYVADSTVTLYAGQDMDAGTVHFSSPVSGVVTITITLNAGWRFYDDPGRENIKIQDYATAPSDNPSPGSFEWKGYATGSPFSIEVPANNFYGVHVDVEREVCE